MATPASFSQMVENVCDIDFGVCGNDQARHASETNSACSLVVQRIPGPK
jgi:hypothetical protein